MTADSPEATTAAEATADTPADRQAESGALPATTAGDATATAKGAGQHLRCHSAATSKDMCTIQKRGRGPLSTNRTVSRCHRGGRMENINAWYLNTHMVYL